MRYHRALWHLKKIFFDYIEKKLRSFTGIGNVLFPKQSGTYKELVGFWVFLMLNIHCLYSCVSMACFIIKYLKIINAMRFLNDC